VIFPVKLDISEKEYMQQIIDLARLTGHYCYHTFDSRRSEPGMTDLVILKATRERPLFVEVKTENGELTEHQEIVKQILEAMPGADYRLWRPSDWTEVEMTLVGRTRR
jgi:VRR-NUC domain